MDDVLAEPDLHALYADELPGFVSLSDASLDIRWVTYTCRGGRVLNNAIVHPTQDGEGEEDLWHSTVSKKQVLARLNGIHPALKKMVHMANEDGIKAYHLSTRPPLSTFVRGRAAIVGDAAHTMLPSHGAGGAVGIESAASLEVLLKGVDGKDEALVKQRLQVFDQLRIPRCNLTLLVSNAGDAWLRVPGLEDEIRRYYLGPLPPAGAIAWGRQFRELLFSHDEFSAAEAALAQAEASATPAVT
jgi:salicylate hydroxylase